MVVGSFRAAVLVLICAFSILGNVQDSYAQTYPRYQAPQRSDFQDREVTDAPQAAKMVADAMAKSLGKVNEAVQEIEQVANDLSPGGSISNRTVMGHENIARKHPHGDQGHLPQGESWNVYSQESKAILGKDANGSKKFVNCLEWREVQEREYVDMCKTNCPDMVDPTNGIPVPGLRCECNPFNPGACIPQRRMVIEYYWPSYTIAMNKAGSRDLDPTSFGPQARRDLERPQITQSWRQLHEQILDRIARKIPGFDKNDFKRPDWWSGEFELQQHGLGDEGFDSLVFARGYRPNFEWRAANDRPTGTFLRPRDHLGWAREAKSIHWALPKPPVQKHIISNSSDQQLLWMMTVFPEFMQLYGLLDRDDYRHIVNMPQNQQSAKNNTIWQTQLGPSLRAARKGDDNRDYRELRVFEVRPSDGGQRDRDVHLLRSGETLRPDNVGSMFSPVMSRHAAVAASWLFLYGSTNPSIQAYNNANRRHVQFSLYKNRDSKNRTTYVGLNQRPEKNRVVDKMSFVSPTSKDGEGSYCFRPENIPNYETAADDETFPKDALKYKHRGEVKIVGWNKRVLCACEHCGTFRGTLTLHDGDVKEDTYLGKAPMNNPPVFTKAIPFWHGYADKKQMEPLRPPVWEGMRLGQHDEGNPGPINGTTSTSPATSVPDTRPDPLLYLCALGIGIGNGGNGQAPGPNSGFDNANNPGLNDGVYGGPPGASPSAPSGPIPCAS